MQYALTPAPGADGAMFLMDASEYVALNAYVERRVMPSLEVCDESVFVWRVVYGAAMASPLHAPDDLVAAIMATRSCAYGRLAGRDPATCRLSELRDIEFFAPIAAGKSIKHPFAALLGTIEDIPKPERQALTLFPRYSSMDVLTNVINRPFLLAVKGEEGRAGGTLKGDTETWRAFIRPDRVAPIAAKCR